MTPSLTPQDGFQYVFVYGTLMQGLCNHGLLAVGGVRLLGPGRTKENMLMVVKGGLPFVSRSLPRCQVLGELYEVPSHVLAALDRLEGHPTWYRREEVVIQWNVGPGRWIDATAYMYLNDQANAIALKTRSGAEEVPDGDYRPRSSSPT